MSENVAVIVQRVSPHIDEANALVVKDVGAIEAGRNLIRGIRALKQEIESAFDPIITKAHQAHKEALAQKKRYVEPLDNAENLIKQKIAGCLAEIERQATIEAEKRAEEARRAREREIERERKRLDALCDKAVSLYEQLDILNQEIDRGDLTEEQETVLYARRNTLLVQIQHSDGVIIEKQAVIEEKATALPTAEPVVSVKVQGMAMGQEKEPSVINPMALVKAVAEGRIPINIVSWDMKAIKKLVNAGMVLPGVSVTLKRNIKVRG